MYSPPDSVVVDRIQRAFPSDELRERARATNLVQRERKFDIVALFYTLAFGFAVGSDRSLQAFLERYVEMADCDELSYAAYNMGKRGGTHLIGPGNDKVADSTNEDDIDWATHAF